MPSPRHWLLEEMTLSNPTIILTNAALQSFSDYLSLDLAAAMYSGLGLLTASPINTTHVICIRGTFKATDSDPSTAFAIDEVKITPSDTYESLLAAERRKKPVNLTKYHSAVVQLWDRTSGRVIVHPHYCKNILGLTKAEQQVGYGAYEGSPNDWKLRLRCKAAISNIKIKKGMEPEMTQREFSRWEEGNKVHSCQPLPASDPESGESPSDTD